MKPIIGVTPDYNAGDRKEWGGREPTYFLRARYVRAIEELGGIPLILPLVADCAARTRLLKDIDGLDPERPDLLGAVRRTSTVQVSSRERTTLTFELERVIWRDTPICGARYLRRQQAMNVACGGSLFQDIPSQITKCVQHRQTTPATHLSHAVTVTSGSLLRRILRTMSLRVNSSHHQSVKAVAPSLIASALASDGIVEAIESPTHRFFLGIQWHPEFLFDRHPLHRKLFEALLRAASRRSS